MSAEQRAIKAARFRQLSEDGALLELFDGVEKSIADEWKRTFDAVERDNLWRSIQVLNKLRQCLQSGISAGLSQTQLTELRRVAK